MKCHLSFEVIVKREPIFLVDDKCIYDPKCSNKMLRNVFQSRKIITPREFLIDKINWEKKHGSYLINSVSPIKLKKYI